jgi:hypothetical protein
MLCPMCRELMGEMYEECSIFFEKQEFIVTDFSKFKVKHRRIYKRLDHFKEVLCQFQGKEGKDIPKEVVERIRENIIKDKVPKDSSGGLITLDDVKQSLRRLKLNTFVENIIYVHHLLTGAPLPYIEIEIEDKMIRLFKQVGRVFELTRSRVPFAQHAGPAGADVQSSAL